MNWIAWLASGVACVGVLMVIVALDIDATDHRFSGKTLTRFACGGAALAGLGLGALCVWALNGNGGAGW
jgi:hypothetical protein